MMNKMKVRIGLDFDNTIVCYDEVFAKLCLEFPDFPVKARRDKSSVKEYLVSKGLNSKWTELQGLVYGPSMRDAKPYLGVVEVLRDLEDKGFGLVVISHRTRYPYRGQRFDLHRYAHQWVESHLGDIEQFKNAENIFFLESLDDKVRKANELRCDYFFDDLKSVLTHPDFDKHITKILFDPRSACLGGSEDYSIVNSWIDFAKLVLKDG